MTTRNAFSHFDGAHRENFCASVLLLAVELDPLVREALAARVRSALSIPEATPLVAFGREARLEETDDDTFARVDLWFLFGELGHAFVEVKTHDRWDAHHVAEQVRDQSSRPGLARGRRTILGSMLLAPQRLCDRVNALDATLPALSWRVLLRELRDLGSPSPLTTHVIRHLEENVDRPTGIADRTLEDFERATTTIACLRQFLLGCITDLGGKARVNGLYTTTGDGAPLSRDGWAWYGLSVPFTYAGRSCHLGIYKYVEAPPGQEGSRSKLWLEGYGGNDQPLASLEFNPKTLAHAELEAFRQRFAADWKAKVPQETA